MTTAWRDGSNAQSSRLTLADEVQRCYAWQRDLTEQLGNMAPGLTLARARLLLTLAPGRKTVGVVAINLDLGASTVTIVTDRLEREGLVARIRTTDPAYDRRNSWLELTPAGRRIVDALQR